MVYLYILWWIVRYTQGDTKGPARGADGIPAKKDSTGAQLGSDAQVAFEFSCSVISSGDY